MEHESSKAIQEVDKRLQEESNRQREFYEEQLELQRQKHDVLVKHQQKSIEELKTLVQESKEQNLDPKVIENYENELKEAEKPQYKLELKNQELTKTKELVEKELQQIQGENSQLRKQARTCFLTIKKLESEIKIHKSEINRLQEEIQNNEKIEKEQLKQI